MRTRELEPRVCQGCGADHPPTTTCDGGWAPWDGKPVTITIPGRKAEPPLVALSPADLVKAEEFALERVARSRALGAKDQAGLVAVTPAERLAIDLEGVLGEMAVSLWLGIPFVNGDGPMKVPDVGPAFVRSTRHPGGQLIFRPADPDGPYVLVIDRRPDFRIPGWLHSTVIRTFPLRRPDKTRPACHLVPQDRLRPLPTGAEGIRVLGGLR